MRTLIVEDDFTSRLLLQSFLAQYGECHIAVNGMEAIAAFRASQQSGNGKTPQHGQRVDRGHLQPP